ncbi:MAG: hypothetical protein SGILL_010078 [Bacillariaceae sp.]
MFAQRVAARSIKSAISSSRAPAQRLLSGDTYYDSQSGLHVPIHNEQEIRVFLNVSDGTGDKEPFIPHQLYKRSDEAYEVEDKMEHLVQCGVRGMILPKFQFPRDARNLAAVSAMAPPNFFLLFSQEDPQPHILKDIKENTSVFLFLGDDKLQTKLESLVTEGMHTTLAITENDCMNDVDAITLANNIATMIDTVGGCDFLWLSSKDDGSADKAVEVCEELVYLDVAGPTIKSRLLIDSLNDDVLEDSMFAGVNKFVVDSESDIAVIQEVASSQGKSIVKQ